MKEIKKNREKEYIAKVKKRVSILCILVIAITSIFSLSACKPDDRVYIEVKNPVTGEWCSNKDKEHYEWEFDYTGQPFMLEQRYRYHNKVTSYYPYYTPANRNQKDYVFPSSIPGHVGIYDFMGTYPNVGNSIGSVLDLYIIVYGQVNINGETTVEIEENWLRYIEHNRMRRAKMFKIHIEEAGTYRFELDTPTYGCYLEACGEKGQKDEKTGCYYVQKYLEPGDYTLATAPDPEFFQIGNDLFQYKIITTKIQ